LSLETCVTRIGSAAPTIGIAMMSEFDIALPSRLPSGPTGCAVVSFLVPRRGSSGTQS
jgi:hypothetical protein